MGSTSVLSRDTDGQLVGRSVTIELPFACKYIVVGGIDE
jgi:hypothetical protein